MNESTGFEPRVVETPADFLTSVSGCCCDHAFLLKVLLDGAKIPNRRVYWTDRHVFNEAMLAGHWNVLDATLAFWYHAAWEQIQTRPEGGRSPFQVTVFPHPNLMSTDSRNYRPAIGHLRLEWLLRAAKKTAYPVAYSTGDETCSAATREGAAPPSRDN